MAWLEMRGAFGGALFAETFLIQAGVWDGVVCIMILVPFDWHEE